MCGFSKHSEQTL